jgi:hypothetical protein
MGDVDDRLQLVTEENRDRLQDLLALGDPAVAKALEVYRSHVRWARELQKTGSVRADEIPQFVSSESGKLVLGQSGDTLIALAATLMADKAMRVRESEEHSPLKDVDHLTERLLDRLAVRKLPYQPIDAAVLVDLATTYPWLEQLRVALSAARSVLDAGPSSEVIEALRRLDALLSEIPKTLLISKVMGYQPQVKALLADRSGELPLGTDDAFGAAASRLVAERYADQPAAELLAFLAAPRGTRAARSWWSEAERRASRNTIFSRLVIDLLDLVSTIDLTGGTREEHGFYYSDVVLLGEINTIVVRGAAWSARFVNHPDILDVLARAVLRCSSLVVGPWGVEPMASKVAYAAVDSVVAIGSNPARAELHRLLDEVQAVPVLRKIGGALEIPEAEIKALIKERGRHRLVHKRKPGD